MSERRSRDRLDADAAAVEVGLKMLHKVVEGYAAEVAEAAEKTRPLLEKHGVTVDAVRPVDLEIASGVYPDMTEHGWVSDQWPALYERVKAADILVVDGVIAEMGRVEPPADAEQIDADGLIALKAECLDQHGGYLQDFQPVSQQRNGEQREGYGPGII